MNILMKDITFQKGIAVYCASSENIAPAYFDAAKSLGSLIAKAGLPVINGGGRMGLMAAVTDGALQEGGIAIGVIPRFMVEAGRAHSLLSKVIVTEDMHQRKATMAAMARGVIALPGGVGTLEELAEMMTWRKLSLYEGPVVILNIAGYYDSLIQWLNDSVQQGFTEASHLPWIIANTPEEALKAALS